MNPELRTIFLNLNKAFRTRDWYMVDRAVDRLAVYILVNEDAE